MSDSRPTVAIIGASNDRSKYGNKAVRAFRDQGWKVFPVHPSLSEVEGIPAYPDLSAIPVEQLDRVSFYVPPAIGLKLIDTLRGSPLARSGSTLVPNRPNLSPGPKLLA